ncbi:low molecular weight protein-tyrosine-phosphatase [Dyella flava]|uniref:protein-tyrosine-phosphatase n=1 Tax=Dyella flava TaxID=1920170 RepID=A0ABS2K0K1_9GAMM|nr:low molecular weight protein-tyrosine-phosphatase [Dyella flava]MBM7124772.1 low molecular weight phosphotyrosine protein phosphatase [Dyella flava]GLQ50817.1 protein-tyrosine-phosphatase [Dyella flava]
MIGGVLVVCVGNLCRSPMAEGLLRRAMPGMKVTSAGIQARAGMSADPYAVSVMLSHHIDISGHRSQPLSGALCAGHDVMFVMDEPLKQHVLNRYPQLRGRVHLLDREGIADPYRQPHDVFVNCYERIAAAVDAWQPRLSALLGASARDMSSP